ncbi:MAG: hypothetical protein KGD64_08775 [Candidatus Heimdallarchaeota archaeon]|nr:hypothetical protein [Candidatus Heimdallarchaeota archaeon]
MSDNKDNENRKKKPDFRSQLSDAYKSMDKELVETQKEDKETRQEVMAKGIEKIEKKNFKEVMASRMLVNKVLEIREKAGMSQTIGTAGKVKAPLIFGKDDFKQKLVKELLIIGNEELEDIGGAITLANLIDYFKETRTNWKVDVGDILDVLKKLEEKEIIPTRVDLGEEDVLIRFKPIEMSTDFQEVLRLATGLPSLTIAKVSSHLGWSVERAQSTMTIMMKYDLAVLDEVSGEYYFPGLSGFD